ncbi:UNVERIFIED_CONTAM: hypothetical protein RKD50_006677 [Streptomyces canus]
MSGYLVPDRFHVTAYNGDHQASAILRWEGENHDCTMTAVGPWGQVSGKGAGTAADGQQLTRPTRRKRRQDLPVAEQPWALAERSAKALNAARS